MTDAEIQQWVYVAWARLGMTTTHCGGKGLAVGCPVCKKRA